MNLEESHLIIESNNVTKHFGKTIALDNVTLKVKEGEIYGFVGLNGAGKTTLIRILLGMIRSNEGQVKIFGDPPDRRFPYWNKIGYIMESPHAYGNLSVRENLQIFYKLRRLSDKHLVQQVIEQLRLTPFMDVKARHLSLGNYQRLGLAKALMHKPRLLLLDEPINGLDPLGIIEVRELLKELSRSGCTIFLSSHILEEIAKVATRIGIIHQGCIIDQQPTKVILENLDRKLIVNTRDNFAAARILSEISVSARASKEELIIEDEDVIRSPERITAFLSSRDLPPAQVKLFTENLENYFLNKIREI